MERQKHQSWYQNNNIKTTVETAQETLKQFKSLFDQYPRFPLLPPLKSLFSHFLQQTIPSLVALQTAYFLCIREGIQPNSTAIQVVALQGTKDQLYNQSLQIKITIFVKPWICKGFGVGKVCGTKEMFNCEYQGNKLQTHRLHTDGYNNSIVLSVGQHKMSKISSFQVEPLVIPPLSSHSQEDLNNSLSLSARSGKDHSIPETNCSHLSASKISTDSEEQPDGEFFDEEQRCQSFHFEGSCIDGLNCKLKHSTYGCQSPKLSKSKVLQNFPELVMMRVQRQRSFLE